LVKFLECRRILAHDVLGLPPREKCLAVLVKGRDVRNRRDRAVHWPENAHFQDGFAEIDTSVVNDDEALVARRAGQPGFHLIRDVERLELGRTERQGSSIREVGLNTDFHASSVTLVRHRQDGAYDPRPRGDGGEIEANYVALLPERAWISV
jgi:hypothetical protein